MTDLGQDRTSGAATDDFKYWAFISYSHTDRKWGDWLHKSLEVYRIPAHIRQDSSIEKRFPRRLFPVFRDREELPTSADLGQALQDALKSSRTLIVICSPRSAKSRWVNEEVLSFKRMGRSNRILCLIVDGEPNATDKGQSECEAFPPAIRYDIDAAGFLTDARVEPIAADVREGRDSRRDARLKLIAGVLGVSFDKLKQRDLQRQIRKWSLIASFLFVILLVNIALAITAMLARNEASRQQQIAQKNYEQAEAQRKLTAAERDRAENNFRDAREAVDRFYTKVSEEQLLLVEGLQPLRAQLLQEALEYYQRFLSQKGDDDTVAFDAAIVQGNVGGILADIGDPAEALAANRKASQAFQKLLDANPSNQTILTALSESLGNEATILNELDDSNTALETHLRAIEVYEKLSPNSPERDKDEWHRLLSTKAALEAKAGKLKDAAESYQRALSACKNAEPRLAALGVQLNNGKSGVVVVNVIKMSPAEEAGLQAGDVIRQLGDNQILQVEDFITARKQMIAGKPMQVKISRNDKTLSLQMVPVLEGNFIAAVTMHNLGYLYLHRISEYGKARESLSRAVDEYRRALLGAPNEGAVLRRNILEGLLQAEGELGTCNLWLGDKESAAQSGRSAVKISECLVSENPEVPRYRSRSAVYMANLATILGDNENDLDERIELTQNAIGNCQFAIQKGGNLAGDRYQLFQLMRNLALLMEEKDGPEAAIPILQSSFEVAAGLEASNIPPSDLNIAMAEASRSLGKFLRDTDRPEEAALQYDAASKHYQAALETLPQVSGRLLTQVATLEGTRISVHAQLGDEKSSAAAAERLDNICKLFNGMDNATDLNCDVRLNAAEACADQAYSAFPREPSIATKLLATAAGQLEKAGYDASQPIANMFKDLVGKNSSPSNHEMKLRMLNACRMVSACQLRADIRSGNAQTAWKRLENHLKSGELNQLPACVKIDLAASFLAAKMPKASQKVLLTIPLKADQEKGSVSRADAVSEQLDDLRLLGISDDILTRLKKLSAEKDLDGDGRLPAGTTAVSDPSGTVVNSIGMKLLPIVPGEFLMGTDSDDAEEFQHRVRITRPFLLGMHEVTQSQYELVMGSNPSFFKGENLPVEHLSWQQAFDFCKRLSDLPEEKTAGRRYRLPTEAEWEYACRAGTNSDFNTGNKLNVQEARFSLTIRSKPNETVPVGTYPPNSWGLYDMHGNVWEWTNDWFSSEYYRLSPIDDPQGPAEGTRHTLRGGSASVCEDECRSSIRGEAEADGPGHNDEMRYEFYGDFGLRVVCVLQSN